MELLETAKTAKEMGNSEFKKKEMHRAQELYQDALESLEKCEDQSGEVLKL